MMMMLGMVVSIQVLGYGMRVHPDMGVLQPVALEVHLEVAFGREAVSTDVTLEGALTCKTQSEDNGKKQDQK